MTYKTVMVGWRSASQMTRDWKLPRNWRNGSVPG